MRRLEQLWAELEQLHPDASRSERVNYYYRRMIDLLNQSGERALERDHPDAHFTASAFIFSPQGAVLALFHKKLERWLQPGGHMEDSDRSALACAMREAEEESGLSDLSLIFSGPIDLDIHTIPARETEREHNHFDVRYAFVTSTPQKAKLSAESTGLEWLSGDALTHWMEQDESISRPISLARSLLNSR